MRARDASTDLLGTLLDPTEGLTWSATDLRGILDHLLETPLESELRELADSTGLTPAVAARLVADSGCRTFSDVLFSADVPDRAYGMLKSYSKECLAPSSDIPRDVGRVLYIASIVRGRQAGFADVTSLDARILEREIRRCLTYAWLPGRVRQLLSAGPESDEDLA